MCVIFIYMYSYKICVLVNVQKTYFGWDLSHVLADCLNLLILWFKYSPKILFEEIFFLYVNTIFLSEKFKVKFSNQIKNIAFKIEHYTSDRNEVMKVRRIADDVDGIEYS